MTSPAGAASNTSLSPPSRGTAELSTVADLGDAARAIASIQTPPPKAFVAMLLERELHVDAVRFLAHGLPRREAVWWAWVCARKAAGDAPAPPIKDRKRTRPNSQHGWK